MISQLRSAPNQLTLLRLIFIPFVVIAVMEDHHKTALALFVVAGISDVLDGLLARILKQQTALGLYLDPIADKLLLSTLFLALSLDHRRIPWYLTVLVFSRDIGILIVSALLYATNTLRDLRPSIFGKLNTAAQVGTVFLVLLDPVVSWDWLHTTTQASFRVTFALTLISWIHYTIVVGRRLRTTPHSG
jgi:cardiolipin synthase